ncbi:S8 family serine peptidase [Thalassiella azotivora]
MAGRTTSRVVLAALSGLALTAGVLAPSAAVPSGAPAPPGLTATPLAPDEVLDTDKAPTARVARTDPSLLARDDAEPVRVLIKLDHDSTAAYAGGVRGLAPTSPSVTGRALTGRSAAERAYERYQREREDDVRAAIERTVPQAQVGEALRTVYGGLTATVPANAVETLLAVDGVAAVQLDELRQLLTDSSPEFIEAPPVYADLGGSASAGEGVLYGNLDSGVWPEHPSFADPGTLPDAPAGLPCDFGDNPLTAQDDPFACNDKLVGGRAFLDTYLSDPARAQDEPFHTARDSNGHGTHTASTSAGSHVDDVSILGGDLPAIHGVAPGAWVMVYKVCGVIGCFGSDSAAAVAQAVLDGVDVINFSISGGTDPYTDPVELAFLDAYAAGVLVSASAGNDGPGAGTANHLGPWTTTVAASTQTRELATTLTLTAADGSTARFRGASVTPGVDEHPVVMAADPPYNRPLCDAPAPPGTFDGVVVACQRGVNARVDKGFNVLQGGAEGMVLFNPSLADTNTDTHWLPTVHLPDGTDLVAFMAAHDDVTGSFPAGAPAEGQGDVMAAFSSRGPAGVVLKPDVTAPGVQVLAGDTPVAESTTSGPPGEYFQAIAGTSMSSPHVAGAALLLRHAHPDWTPGQVRSALMTTATTDVVKEDLTTPADPFDMGAGRIRVAPAADAPMTLDESAGDYLALGADARTAVHLNLPSVYAPVMPGRLTTTRELTSTSDRPQIVTTGAQAGPGTTITVSPRRVMLLPGRTVEVTITIEASTPLGTTSHGQVLLSTRERTLHLPVAFTHTQGTVALTQSCDPGEVTPPGTTECTVEAVNTGFEDQVVDLTSTVSRELRVVAADGAERDGPRTVRLDDVTLTGARPGVPAVDPGDSPAGYLPLALFGIAPTAVGDEQVLNLDVPAFRYNGRTWTRLGVSTNGYLVVGGATAEDNNCCTLPDGPDPAPPNNVLAPFWTDLDGTGAPGVSAGSLTDGVSTWVVVEFALNVFGTTDQRTFQVWLRTGGEQDITFTYPPEDLPTDPAGQDFLVGAENEAGQGDVEAVLPTSDLRVTSSDPADGGSVGYAFTARGLSAGTATVTTEMTASGVSGTTRVVDEVVVLPR